MCPASGATAQPVTNLGLSLTKAAKQRAAVGPGLALRVGARNVGILYVPDGGLTGAQIQLGSLTLSHLDPGAKAALRGEPGPQGERGLRGEPGLQGPQGLPGVQGIARPSPQVAHSSWDTPSLLAPPSLQGGTKLLHRIVIVASAPGVLTCHGQQAFSVSGRGRDGNPQFRLLLIVDGALVGTWCYAAPGGSEIHTASLVRSFDCSLGEHAVELHAWASEAAWLLGTPESGDPNRQADPSPSFLDVVVQ